MAAPEPKVRFAEAASLLDYGFANCTGYLDQTSTLKLPDIPVENGVQEVAEAYVDKDFSYTLCKGESGDQIKRSIEYKNNLTAPVKRGDVIGRIVYSLDDQTLEEIPIYAAKDIKKATYSDGYGKLLKRFLVS